MRAGMIQRKIRKNVSSCCMERKWLPWSLIHQVRTREELKNENVSYLTESVAGQSRSKNPSGCIETGWRGPAIVAFVCFTRAVGALYRVRIRAPPGFVITGNPNSVIEHNWRPRPGFGSCIFLHGRDTPRRGTSGCTAVSSAHLEQLLHWLDAQKNPLIVQLPLPEYFILRQFWELPVS